MKTIILEPTEENLIRVGKSLFEGELAAIPTETVYGLAANALNESAVRSIFDAKGRPQDNPLIIHIAAKEDALKFVTEIPYNAQLLMDEFWPGPLTIILNAKSIIPKCVTAGLNTVAVRCPDNEIARKLIKYAGVPLAAPSANTSGKPSPTSAEHVYHDMNGKIPYIINGGICDIGVESTVITLANEKPMLLRPGQISREEIEEIIGPIDVSDAVYKKMDDSYKAQSPGMKYRHYAPNAIITVIESDEVSFRKYVNEKATDKDGILCFEGEEKYFDKGTIITLGNKNDPSSLSHNLFDSLRAFDEKNVENIYAHSFTNTGKYLGVYNRLMKASGYNIIKLGDN